MAREYIKSISGDSLLYKHHEGYSNEALVVIMESIKAFVDEVFGRLQSNFFIGGTYNQYKENVLDYTHIGEENIRYLRYIDSQVDASI